MNGLEAFRNISIGMDALIDKLVKANDSAFPPYNLYKVNDNNFKIELAMAGYLKEDISISVENGILLISANKASNLYSLVTDKTSFDIKDKDNNNVCPIHNGIAGRWFNKSFQLADDILVIGASFKEGILTIDLTQPEPPPPTTKTIAIK